MSLSLRKYRVPALAALLALATGWAAPALAAGNVINAPNMGGGSAWTVYAFGNAQAVSDAFRAIYNFTSSGLFQSLTSMMAVIGILTVGLTGGFNSAQAKRLMGYIVGVFLLAYVMFGATNNGPLVVRVEVIDTVDNTWKAPVTVPAVVGIPAALISTAGFQITKQIEASFPIPDELKLSNGAPFNLATSMLSDTSRARITDPNLASSLAYYVQDCFTMGVASGALSAQTLLNSTDFINDIRFPHNSVMVNTLLKSPEGSPAVVTCLDAWSLIKGKVDSFTEASSMLSSASAWSRTPALSVVNAAADSTAQWATNNGITNGASMIKQAAMLSAFQGAYRQTAAATGNSDFLTGLALNQAHETQVNGWITSAEVFNRSMGYVYAVLQVFVYAAAPLILAAAVLPGIGLALLKNFGQILLWLTLWQPMLGIANFLVLSMQQSELGGAMSSAGAYGFTLTNMGIISEKTANLRAAATFLGTMVPVLTWALVKGGMDFSRFIGSAMGESMANQAASTISTGNYSLNQASMDSFTSNKHSIAPSGAWGSGFSSSDFSTGRKLDGGGSSLMAVGGQQASMTVGATTGTSQAGNVGQATADATQGGNSTTASRAGGVTTAGAVSENLQTSETSTHGTSAGAGFSAGGGFSGAGRPGSRAEAVPGTNGTVPTGAGPVGGAAGGDIPGVLDQRESRVKGSADARGTLQTGVSGQHTVANVHGRSANTSTSGTDSRTGTNIDNGGRTVSTTKNAAQNDGYQSGLTQSIQMGATAFDRNQLLNAQLRMDAPAFGTSYLSTSRPAQPRTEIEQKADQLATPGAVPESVSAAKGDVSSRLDTQDAEALRLKATAESKAERFRDEGDAARGAASGFVNDPKRRAEVERGAITGAALATKEVFGDLGSHAPQWAKDAWSNAGDKTSQALSFMGKTKDDLLEKGSGLIEKGKEVLHGAPDAQQPREQLVNAQRAAMSLPQTPEQTQQAAFGVPPRGALPRNQAPASTNPATPQPAGNGDAAPEMQRNAPGTQPQGKGGTPQSTQVGKTPDEQEREKNAVAAASPAPVIGLMNAPQVQQPEPATVAQAPTQVAMVTPAPVADPQSQQGLMPPAATPNPFSGQAEQSPGATQAQVQIAEQRAERLDNQMRNADSMLMAADSRPASEHLEIIHQAREITGSRSA